MLLKMTSRCAAQPSRLRWSRPPAAPTIPMQDGHCPLVSVAHSIRRKTIRNAGPQLGDNGAKRASALFRCRAAPHGGQCPPYDAGAGGQCPPHDAGARRAVPAPRCRCRAGTARRLLNQAKNHPQHISSARRINETDRLPAPMNLRSRPAREPAQPAMSCLRNLAAGDRR